MLTMGSSVDAAIQLVKEAQAVCEKGRLHLHKFVSNNREVLESIPDSERASGVRDVALNLDEPLTQTVLGVKWSVNCDTFSFRVTLDKKTSNTARNSFNCSLCV